MVGKANKPEETESSEENEPQSLVGSAAPTVKVRAVVGCYGLAAGEERVFPSNDFELKILIEQEKLVIVSE